MATSARSPPNQDASVLHQSHRGVQKSTLVHLQPDRPRSDRPDQRHAGLRHTSPRLLRGLRPDRKCRLVELRPPDNREHGDNRTRAVHDSHWRTTGLQRDGSAGRATPPQHPGLHRMQRRGGHQRPRPTKLAAKLRPKRRRTWPLRHRCLCSLAPPGPAVAGHRVVFLDHNYPHLRSFDCLSVRFA